MKGTATDGLRIGRVRPSDPRVLAIASAIVALIDVLTQGAGTGSAPGSPVMAASPTTPDTYYTSRKGGPHMPGKSRAWMLRHARTIPGARKIGRDWVIKASEFERYLVEQDIARVKREHTGQTINYTDEALVEEAMRINGLRPNRAGA